ncbi:hypothetical protein [Ochrobactrum sp. AP1BH01-1]|nr:hypothetical protein [Ochrobactrum sp. AP1BH01-1]MBQ0707066.1 hypothetical protein [Ochrobactrum sp. AP1BH01-1]
MVGPDDLSGYTGPARVGRRDRLRRRTSGASEREAMEANKTNLRDAVWLAQLRRTGFYKEAHTKTPAAHGARLADRKRPR